MATVSMTPDAFEEFNRLPVAIRRRIQVLFERLADWPEVSGAKPLRGNLAGWFRMRTGDYRVRFAPSGDQLIIDKIGHRSTFYED